MKDYHIGMNCHLTQFPFVFCYGKKSKVRDLLSLLVSLIFVCVFSYLKCYFLLSAA